MSSPAPFQNQDRVVDRLRQLELRLNSITGKQSFEPENLRDALTDFENARGTFSTESVRHASVFALELAKAIDSRISARLNKVADRAVARLNATLPAPVTVLVEQRLEQQEKQVPEMIRQLADLRRSAVALEGRLTRAGEDLDLVWKQQDPDGLGGWRLVMRAVSAQVELEKQQKPVLTDSYRVVPQAESEEPAAISNLFCFRCKDISLRRIARESILEEALRIIFVAPYRCSNCGIRSYHFRYAVKTAD